MVQDLLAPSSLHLSCQENHYRVEDTTAFCWLWWEPSCISLCVLTLREHFLWSGSPFSVFLSLVLILSNAFAFSQVLAFDRWVLSSGYLCYCPRAWWLVSFHHYSFFVLLHALAVILNQFEFFLTSCTFKKRPLCPLVALVFEIYFFLLLIMCM